MIMTSCAQRSSQVQHQAVMQNDLGSRLGVNVDYVADAIKAYVIIDINNPRQRDITAWFIQENKSDGEYIKRGSRYYTGNHKTMRNSFKVPLRAAGVVESLHVEVFTGNRLIMKTEPIINMEVEQ